MAFAREVSRLHKEWFNRIAQNTSLRIRYEGKWKKVGRRSGGVYGAMEVESLSDDNNKPYSESPGILKMLSGSDSPFYLIFRIN